MAGATARLMAFSGVPLGRPPAGFTVAVGAPGAVVARVVGVSVGMLSVAGATTGVSVAAVVAVGAKIAVRVRFGVGRAKGVGEAVPGMTQARAAAARTAVVRIRTRRLIRTSTG
jgi:hypothetical protein